MAQPDVAAASPDAEEKTLSRKERRHLKEQERIESLRPLQERLASDDPSVQLEAAREFRSIVEGEHPPLDAVLGAGMVPRLLQLSECHDQHDLQFEVLLVLTTLTSSSTKHAEEVAECAALEPLLRLVSAHDAVSVREEALGIISSIASASAELRDKAVEGGAASSAVHVLSNNPKVEQQRYYDKVEKLWKLRSGEPEKPISLTRVATRCLGSLCQEPPCDFGETTRPLLHALATLAMSSDEEVLVEACKAIASLNYGAEEFALLEKEGLGLRLTELRAHTSPEVQSAATLAAEKLEKWSGAASA